MEVVPLTAPYIAYTVDAVYTVYTIYTVDMVFHC